MGTLKKPFPLININKKFILFTNAKCGGTTLKSWFLDSLNLENTFSNSSQMFANYGFVFGLKWYKYSFLDHDLDKLKNLNSFLRKFIKIYRSRTKGKIKKHINDASFYKIAVVRNPYDRLVSGYVDKFCGKDLKKSWVRKVLKEVNSKDPKGNYQITFSQFVDYLLNHDLEKVNSHWRGQTYILKDVKLDEVIHLENMSVRLPELSQKLGFESSINLATRRQSNNYENKENIKDLVDVFDISNTDLIAYQKTNGSFPKKDTFYNDSLRQKVKTIYKDDFDAFDF